jgi:hypothetical protein
MLNGVSAARRKRPKQLLLADGTSIGDRTVEPEAIADHDQRGRDRRAEIADESAHELIQLAFIDRLGG